MTRKAYSPGQDQVKQAVNRARNRAEDYLKDPDRSKRLLEQAVRRANDREGTGGAKADFWTNLKAFFRLTRAYLRGQYTTIPWGSVVMVVAAILYFVSPLDLMPDWIPWPVTWMMPPCWYLSCARSEETCSASWNGKAIRNLLNRSLTYEEQTGEPTMTNPILTPQQHKELGISLFNHVWELMDKTDKTRDEEDEMLSCAYASHLLHRDLS